MIAAFVASPGLHDWAAMRICLYTARSGDFGATTDASFDHSALAVSGVPMKLEAATVASAADLDRSETRYISPSEERASVAIPVALI